MNIQFKNQQKAKDQQKSYAHLLRKYYNKYGQEQFVPGERWSAEKQKEHFRQRRLQDKMVILRHLGFRISAETAHQVDYIIRLLDKNFNSVDRSLSNEQILVMILCYVRIRNDKNCNKARSFKILEEYDISLKTYVSFLHKLLDIYVNMNEDTLSPKQKPKYNPEPKDCADCPKKNIFIKGVGSFERKS